jgi:hypothetical protein
MIVTDGRRFSGYAFYPLYGKLMFAGTCSTSNK